VLAEPPIHVIFTMDCQPAGTRQAPEGPKGWGLSARSIEGFCTCLRNEGFTATLFLTPWCADTHGPLVDELSGRDVELGLLVHPQSLFENVHKDHVGRLSRERQRAVIALAMRRFQEARGARPRSCRTAMFSASDDTYAILHELGFLQGSVSSPGRRLPRFAAEWTGAVPDPHYTDPSNRLIAGDLRFLEIPVTTDTSQVRGGLAFELIIENGSFDNWHRPLIESQLQRMERERVPFRALCFATRNCFAYGAKGDLHSTTLAALLDYLEALRERYDVIPTTLSGAHAAFRDQLKVVPV
jgi:hypothetical protein